MLFESDVAYTVIMALFSISNGYVGSICMISGPQVTVGSYLRVCEKLTVEFVGSCIWVVTT